MFLVAGEKHVGAQVFTGELLPWRRQVFLFVYCFNLHVQYHMEQLGILLRRITGIELWSERKIKMYQKENGRQVTDIKCWCNINLLVKLQRGCSRSNEASMKLDLKDLCVGYLKDEGKENV